MHTKQYLNIIIMSACLSLDQLYISILMSYETETLSLKHNRTSIVQLKLIRMFSCQVNYTSNCNYDYEMLYFDHLIDFTRQNLCPDLSKSEVSYQQNLDITENFYVIFQEYCDLLIGRVTPLLFPWLFPSLTYILYIDK